jgi:hypothetical protein
VEIVRRITVETRWLPPIVIDRPLEPSATQNPLMDFLKPRISVSINPILRASPVVSEPWGSPGVSQWPQVRVALAVGAFLLAGVFVYRVLR